MLNRLSAFLGGLPVAGVVALVAVIVVQLALQVFCLIDLYKRTWVPGGRKWVFALLVIAGNLIGAIVYLAVIRPATPPLSDEDRQIAHVRDAGRYLYGDRDPK